MDDFAMWLVGTLLVGALVAGVIIIAEWRRDALRWRTYRKCVRPEDRVL